MQQRSCCCCRKNKGVAEPNLSSPGRLLANRPRPERDPRPAEPVSALPARDVPPPFPAVPPGMLSHALNLFVNEERGVRSSTLALGGYGWVSTEHPTVWEYEAVVLSVVPSRMPFAAQSYSQPCCFQWDLMANTVYIGSQLWFSFNAISSLS